jgi:polyisoprenyl-phosphate glycosyltransferase
VKPAAADRPGATGASLVVLMPVYNDWAAVPLLLDGLEEALAGAAAEVILIDDGSSMAPEDGRWLADRKFRNLTAVTIVRLGRNVGHQRAIAIGLAYVHARRTATAVVVMDADGEDDPADVPRLVEACAAGGPLVVFAGRARRSEGLVFRSLYRVYRLLFRLVTGASISFGNFSVVSGRVLPRLVLLSELWNHYPSAVMKAKIPMETVPTLRARRLAGESHMSLVSLILHGLGGISVYGDVIGVRALLATLVAVALCLGGIGGVVSIRVLTDLAIPGWASYVAGLLVAILLQTVSLSLFFIFVILNSRNYSTVIPRRDYEDYILAESRVYP